MRVSIALATYNGRAHLSDQLASFVDQSRLPDELVVVDDGSDDGTPGIVLAFAARAPFPVDLVVNGENLGYAQNFGKALSLCSGDLVFLSDQDDVWLSNKIERMIASVVRYPSAVCFMNDALLADRTLKRCGSTKMGQIRAAGLPDSAFVMGSCVALKRDFLDIALPIPGFAPSHDSWLVGLADHLKLSRRIPVVLQYYRRHGANVSDFFVNRIDSPSAFRSFMEGVMNIKRRVCTGDSLDNEFRFHKALETRLLDRREVCTNLVGSKTMGEIDFSLAKRLEVLSARWNIRRTRLSQRPHDVVSLWRKGGYEESGGALGAIKDLVLVTQ